MASKVFTGDPVVGGDILVIQYNYLVEQHERATDATELHATQGNMIRYRRHSFAIPS